MTEFLSVEHMILERPFMEFRPFGIDEQGAKIRDVTGLSVQAMVDYMQRYLARTAGAEAAQGAVGRLSDLLNERIRDSAYHVSPAFLRNAWNSYSYEFVCYVYELCGMLSGDPDFAFHAGKEKISPIIQTMGRPFSTAQIYRMYGYFAAKYSVGTLEPETEQITDTSAILRYRFTERSYRQFGAYRKRCAFIICRSHHGSNSAIPERVHGLPPATVRDLSCIVQGDEWCTYEIRWQPKPRRGFIQSAVELIGGGRHVAPNKSVSVPMGQHPHPSSKEGVRRGAVTAAADLLSKEHTILERPYMLFRPFGVDESGQKIEDASGVTVRSNLECLEDSVARKHGPAAAQDMASKLCALLNERIRDPAYHVTPEFLRNDWHSYSYEFVSYVREFCKQLSGDPKFQIKLGIEKIVSPVIQILGRPFAVQQIFRMYPHFAQKYAKGVCEFGVGEVTDHSAVLRLRYTEHALRQLGPYLKACAANMCDQSKAGLATVPEKVHGLPRARYRDRLCIVNGDEWCEWEFTWEAPRKRRWRLWPRRAAARVGAAIAGAAENGLPDPQPRYASGHGDPTGTVVAETRPPFPEERRPELLPPERTILGRPFMQFRPFGVDERGAKINDIRGALVKANVDQLQQHIAALRGTEAGVQAVEELCRLLNERIFDPAYHVTSEFLRNDWNSYSYEFVCYLRELAGQLSGDPNFNFNVGRNQHASPFIQALGRPFTMAQIARMWPYFVGQFAKGSVECRARDITETSAILAIRFTPIALKQFGPYRKACARLSCEASKGSISSFPARIHGLPPASVRDLTCIAKGDEWCEWEVTWVGKRHAPVWPVWGTWAGIAAFGYLQTFYPKIGIVESLLIGLVPPTVAWFMTRQALRRQAEKREALIHEQVEFVERRHEELREAYLEQEQTRVELNRKVNQLTTLHRAGLLFSSTLDRKTLIQNVLETIVRDLGYDRAMISFYDRARRITHDARVLGVSEDVAAMARAREIPIHDPDSIEGEVLLKGKPVLIGDLPSVWDRLHPLNQELAAAVHAKSLISVPLKVNDMVIGSLTVDRVREHSLTPDDLELIVTLASQVAIALDNTEAYRQIEDLNIGLEAKVRERTQELEKSDRMRSLFLSHVSHDLRTPLTSIKGFVDNLLAGLAGPLLEKQQIYLTRVAVNADRLIRMIGDLLDRTRIETGRLELTPTDVNLRKAVADVVEQLRPLAVARRQRLEVYYPESDLIVWADTDRLAQILINLVDNAVKFTPEEGSISVRIVPGGASFAGVSVEDTGKGIPADAIPKLFDPFFRVSQQERGMPKGLGLGLSIVKNLVDLHGGTISVQSRLGQGTTFFFTVPVRPTVSGQPVRGGKRILVVDDDADIQQLVFDRLGAAGYHVETASDGLKALAAYRAGGLDGIVLDIGMPDLDGLEVLKRIRDQDTRIPIIMVTASGSKQRAIQAVSMGAQAYVLKPFDLHELEKSAEYWFGKPNTEPPQDRVD